MLDLKQIESFYPQQLKPFQRNLLREYLQYKILEIIFASKFAQGLFFMGGTAIHILHSSSRFSEDLDFDNIGLDKNDFKELSGIIQKKLGLEGYKAEIKNSFAGAYRASIRIPDILYESGLSRHAAEKILIQVDTEPQGFQYQPDKAILNKFDVFVRINAVPADILLAQKIYAIFNRRRPMGRDFYDTIFLLAKTKPNFGYLQEKLEIEDMPALKAKLSRKCADLNFKLLAKDLEQFLFTPEDARKVLLFPEYINQSLA